MTWESRIERALARLDRDALVAEYARQGELVFIPELLPRDMVDELAAEARAFSESDIHRVNLPFLRKAGTINHVAIADRAPLLRALHQSPAMLAFTSALANQRLALKNNRDFHAAALYVYRRKGDHVGWHYDDCGCESTASYTSTFGIIDESSSRVVFQMFRDDKSRPMVEYSLASTPGSFVFFCGSKAYHRVTPIRANEHRVTYSFAYVREGKRVTGFRRLRTNIGDALMYFGPKALFQNNY